MLENAFSEWPVLFTCAECVAWTARHARRRRSSIGYGYKRLTNSLSPGDTARFRPKIAPSVNSGGATE